MRPGVSVAISRYSHDSGFDTEHPNASAARGVTERVPRTVAALEGACRDTENTLTGHPPEPQGKQLPMPQFLRGFRPKRKAIALFRASETSFRRSRFGTAYASLHVDAAAIRDRKALKGGSHRTACTSEARVTGDRSRADDEGRPLTSASVKARLH